MKRKILNLLFLLVAIFSIYKIYDYYKPDKTSKIVQDIRKKSNVNDFVEKEEVTNGKTEKKGNPIDKTEKNYKPELVANALSINSDAVGWITVPGTNIDYPVLQTNNNEYYLNHNIIGEYDKDGSIYLDESSKDNDKNLIVYGHNMQNGNMFSTLTKYLNSGFVEKNSEIKYETANEARNYRIIAIAQVDYTDGSAPLLFSEYTNDIEGYYKAIEPYIIWKQNESFSKDNKYISLVTCTFETEDTRTVVIGKEY